MWVGAVLIGVALLCTLLVALSVVNLHSHQPVGGRLAVIHTLALMAVLWVVLGAMLIFCHGGRGGVPPGFILMVYVMGAVAEVASLVVLADREADRIAVVGLRTGIVAIPLVLVFFAGLSL
jgi:hypothetical protein